MFIRCTTGCACDLLLFFAYQYTSYSKAFCLFFTNTLYCPFLATYILNEKVKTWDIIGIIFGFTGMMLLVQPWKSAENISAANDLLGSIFGILSGVLAAVALIYTRKIATNIHFTVQPFYFQLATNIMSSIWSLVPFHTDKSPIYSFQMYLCVLALAAMIIFQQSFFSKSMQYNSVGAVNVLNYMAIPFGYFLDWILMGQTFDGLELIGAGLIFGINIVIATLRIKGYID